MDALRNEIKQLKEEVILLKQRTVPRGESTNVKSTTNGDSDFPPLVANTMTKIIAPVSYSDAAKQPAAAKKAVQKDVTPIRRPQNGIKKGIIGTKKSNNIAVNGTRLMKVFVTRLHSDTSTEGLENYLKEDCDINAKCTKLKTRFDTYSSFKVEAQCLPGFDFLNPEIWPAGTFVKRFYEKRQPLAQPL